MNKKVSNQDFKDYLGEAKSWETDKVQELQKSRTVAWRVATATTAIAFMAVLAVTGLTPLKTVEPLVIRVDNSTGIVDVVEGLKDSKTNYDEAINKYFTQWYVRYREGYSKDLSEDYYTNVGLMSVSLEQQKYFEYFNPKNPLSPLNVYGAYAKVKVSIKGTSFIKPNIALVRYSKAVERGMDRPIVSHWAATITFKYSGSPMKETDRAINPLGFQVVEYRNDPDALPTGAAAIEPAMQLNPAPAAPTKNVQVFPSGASTTPVVPAIQQ